MRLAAGPFAALALASCVPHEEQVTRLRLAVWGTARQAEIERTIVTAFEDAHPGVKIDVLYFSAGYQGKIQAMIVGDSLPDVLMVDDMVYGDWATRGALMDLTPLVQELDARDPFLPLALDLFRVDERYFALPVNAAAQVFYCNLRALAAAGVQLPAKGLTWEMLSAVAPRLARRSGQKGAPTDYACTMPYNASVLLLGLGAHLFDNDRRPSRVALDHARAEAAIEWQRTFLSRHWAPTAAAIQDEGADQLFRSGRLALMSSGRYSSTELKGKTEFPWDVINMPRSPDGRAEVNGTGIAISRRTRFPEEAREFVRFYLSPVAVSIQIAGGRIVPVQRSAAYGPEFLGMHPPATMTTFSENTERGAGTSYLFGAGKREVADLVNWRMQQAVAEPEIPAATIVDLLQHDLEKWLERSQRSP